MNRTEYYNDLKDLAKNIRSKYSLLDYRVLPSTIKMILKNEGVNYIDLSDKLKNIRGAYFYSSESISVLVKKGLPKDPYSFTLAHELKHHLVDQKKGKVICTIKNQSDPIEIGAEIFAAELIFPETDFIILIDRQMKSCNEINVDFVVNFKSNNPTTLSYQGIVKRLEFNRLIENGKFSKVKWKKEEERLNGIPLYKLYKRRKQHNQ
jgi:Zn-dependent peptidase ImmA (M78 family)